MSLITLAFPKRPTVSRLVTSRRRDESRLPRAFLCHTGTGQSLARGSLVRGYVWMPFRNWASAYHNETCLVSFFEALQCPSNWLRHWRRACPHLPRTMCYHGIVRHGQTTNITHALMQTYMPNACGINSTQLLSHYRWSLLHKTLHWLNFQLIVSQPSVFEGHFCIWNMRIKFQCWKKWS